MREGRFLHGGLARQKAPETRGPAAAAAAAAAAAFAASAASKAAPPCLAGRGAVGEHHEEGQLQQPLHQPQRLRGAAQGRERWRKANKGNIKKVCPPPHDSAGGGSGASGWASQPLWPPSLPAPRTLWSRYWASSTKTAKKLVALKQPCFRMFKTSAAAKCVWRGGGAWGQA